jgi:hypothetical protein
MSNGKFRLLETFRNTFQGRVYKHRASTIGNTIGRELFEDLYAHAISRRLNEQAKKQVVVVNRGGGIRGKLIRRNDSVLGRPPAGSVIRMRARWSVPEGEVAEPRIGCEVKILAKSQLKQIDRVISDLENFVSRMKRLNKRCINVAMVGVNYESDYVGYEGGRRFRHVLRPHEPQEVERRLAVLRASYDEVVILRFLATNQRPYPFDWLNPDVTDLDYGAILTRVGELYQTRFR